MPNIKSAIKRVKVSETKNLRNRMVKSATKTSVKKYEVALASDVTAASALLGSTSSAVDKAAAKGVIHKNAANRKKARLARALVKAQAAAKCSCPHELKKNRLDEPVVFFLQAPEPTDAAQQDPRDCSPLLHVQDVSHGAAHPREDPPHGGTESTPRMDYTSRAQSRSIARSRAASSRMRPLLMA